MQVGDATREAWDSKETLLRGEGVTLQEQSIPEPGDLPMTEANPLDSMDHMVTKRPGDHSP